MKSKLQSDFDPWDLLPSVIVNGERVRVSQETYDNMMETRRKCQEGLAKMAKTPYTGKEAVDNPITLNEIIALGSSNG